MKLGNTFKWYEEGPKGLGEQLTRFKNCLILVGNYFRYGDLLVENGKIKDALDVFYAEKRNAVFEVDCEDLLVAPAFIDIQVKGGFGVNFSKENDRQEVGIGIVASKLPQYGVGSFCATLTSNSKSFYKKVLSTFPCRPGSSSGAGILGIHLEGPFLGEGHKGRHEAEYIVDKFDKGVEALENVYGPYLGNVRIITLAPELENSCDVIKDLSTKNIRVLLGYSNGSTEVADRAIQSGAAGLTNVSIGNSYILARNSGISGILMRNYSHRIFYGIVADEAYCSDESLKIAYRTNRKGLMLITDSSDCGKDAVESKSLANNPDCTEYRSELKEVAQFMTTFLSTRSMIHCVRNFVRSTGCDSTYALKCASQHVAQFLGIDCCKGCMNPGYDADFVLLTEEFEVKATYIGGKAAYKINS